MVRHGKTKSNEEKHASLAVLSLSCEAAIMGMLTGQGTRWHAEQIDEQNHQNRSKPTPCSETNSLKPILLGNGLREPEWRRTRQHSIFHKN